MVAAIGWVESRHADHGRLLDPVTGAVSPPIVGKARDGTGAPAVHVPGTGSPWHPDPVWDHPVGPLGFLTAEWAQSAVDAAGDGRPSPHNAYDAIAAMGRLVCHARPVLVGTVAEAIGVHDPSPAFVDEVLATAVRYGMGGAVDGSGPPVGAPPGPPGGPYPEATPADLVEIGQGHHRLVPVARDGFLAWQQAFGSTLWITDSWRSPAQQADCVRRKPTWCAPPEQSWHVKGRAVDVNLGRLGIRGAADAVYVRLVTTAVVAGWCRPAAREPWHFSFGGCG